MKFGIYVGPAYPGDMAASGGVRSCAGNDRTAHESGFDGIFSAHHYALGPSHMFFQPFVMLARMAAECPGMHLGTAAYLLPLTNPVEVAETNVVSRRAVRRQIPVRRGAGLP